MAELEQYVTIHEGSLGAVEVQGYLVMTTREGRMSRSTNKLIGVKGCKSSGSWGRLRILLYVSVNQGRVQMFGNTLGQDTTLANYSWLWNVHAFVGANFCYQLCYVG